MAMMPTDGAINYGGSADSLKGAIASMADNFLFAMVLLLLLMAGLFKSLKDSVLVILSIPLATVGGVIAICIKHDWVNKKGCLEMKLLSKPLRCAYAPSS
jgi:Cu/Ag efflux pump CusA